jgi:hypothetical protein
MYRRLGEDESRNPSGNRIIAAGVEGMATGQTTDRQQASAAQTISVDGLKTVF